MKRCRRFFRRASLVTGFMVMAPFLIVCAGLQPASVPYPSAPPPAGGGGDSGAPIISADGRYVLFASTANNLALLGNGNVMPGLPLPHLNIFVRDRLSASTTLISEDYAGDGGGNATSYPDGISTNGQFVLFESFASNLAANDSNGVSDVFIRDTVNQTNILVSVAPDGSVGNGESRNPAMTPDGRYVAFVSAATNLVAGDTNQIPDIFVRDLQAGTTVLVSVGAQSSGINSIICSSESPVITPDGRYVAFYSTATNLVPGVTNPGEIYVRDLIAGTTTWASTNAATVIQSVMGFSGAISFDPKISTDGQFVAFAARPEAAQVRNKGVILRYSLQTGLTDTVFTNAAAPGYMNPSVGYLSGFEPDAQILDLTPDGRFLAFVAIATNSATCVYQWDALNVTNVLASGNPAGGVATNAITTFPIQSTDGRFVAFYCTDTNLTATVPPANDNLYVRDMQAGATVFVDHNPGIGLGADPCGPASLSCDGGFIAFERTGGNLIPDDNTQDRDVFVTDLTQATTELTSARHPALPSLTANGSSWLFGTTVSTNGRFVAFSSDAANLVPNDTNGYRDVFVHDFLSGTNILVSVGTNGVGANGISTRPTITSDGRYVAFASSARNLKAGDSNTNRDIFLRDLQSQTTSLVSANASGGFGSGDSSSPTISSDGRYVLFRSLVSSGPLNYDDLLLRDRVAGQSYTLISGIVGMLNISASMTPDGQFVALTGGSGSRVYIWDSMLAKLNFTGPSTSASSIVSISPNGQYVAYLAGSPLSLSLVNVQSNIVTLVSAGPFAHPGLTFSSDGRYLAYATSAANIAADTNNTQDIYVYDIQTGTNQLISWNFDFTGSPNGASDSPSISPDGRFVAYRSFASNIVTNNLDGVSDVFLYDRVNNTTTLLCGENRSMTPVFSGDGLTLALQSEASDAVANDFNNSSDVLAYDLIALPGTGLGGFGATNSIPPFSVQMNLTGGSAQTPVPLLSWPLVSGQSYQAQYKDNVGDATWQNVNGGIIFIGDTGYINDLSPSPNQRFYRIVLNNN